MSKPDWKDAPDWAEWLSCDMDGWTWFERKPYFSEDEEVFFDVVSKKKTYKIQIIDCGKYPVDDSELLILERRQ